MNDNEATLELLEEIARNTSYNDLPVKEELEAVNKKLDTIIAYMEFLITKENVVTKNVKKEKSKQDIKIKK